MGRRNRSPLWHAPGVVLRSAFLALLATLPLTGCGPEPLEDRTPPRFDGIESAVVVAPGTALLTWDAGIDDSYPITYRVWTATSSGTQPLDQAPLAETRDTSIQLAGLPIGVTASWFVVRAVDAAGNEDANTVEASVTFAENRLSLLGEHPTAAASDLAVHASAGIVVMGSFSLDDAAFAWIFDVSDPADPAILATIEHGARATDVEITGDVVWVSSELDPDGNGVHAYDISDPADPQPLSTIPGTCHTIVIHEDLLYCAAMGSSLGLLHLWDVSDPANPVERGSIGDPRGKIHDVYVDGDMVVGSFLWLGWAFLDVSDPDAPSMGPLVYYDGAMTHNAWPSEDGRYLFTTDETTNGHLRVWDIADRDAPVQVAEYIVDPGDGPHAIVHNVRVEGNLAYIGWYEAGVVILDVSDPVEPKLVGWYDTHPGPTVGTFAGAWSAIPKGDLVFASNFTGGFFTFELAAPAP